MRCRLRRRLLHFRAQLCGGLGRCTLEILTDLLASASSRCCRGLLELAPDAIGLGDQATVGFGCGIGQAGLQAALPFFAKCLELGPMTCRGFGGGRREGFDLNARPVAFGGEPAFGVGGGIGEASLQTALPLFAHGFDSGRQERSGLYFRLLPRGFPLLCLPIGHLSGLRVQIGLQTRTECVDDRTKIVIGHFRHYRDGLRASQALRTRANPTTTIV